MLRFGAGRRTHDEERLALCAEVVVKWAEQELGDVEAMLAIALIITPGERSLSEVSGVIRSRLAAGALQ